MPLRIWGIPIEGIEKTKIKSWLTGMLDEPRYHRITTVNPEFLLLTKENSSFQQALIGADYHVSDGIGIGLASFLRGERTPPRTPGADIMQELFSVGNEKHSSIFLVLRSDGLSSYADIQTVLARSYPNLRISGIECTPHESDQAWLQAQNSHIVLCNFGAPEQEIFLESLRRQPGQIRLAIGIGGALDYLTQKVKRAPKWMQEIGLEWLWRLSLQPQRWRRIWRAVIIFPFRLLFGKIDS